MQILWLTGLAALTAASADTIELSSQPRRDSVAVAGYLAQPPTGPGPGVLVLHAWWGLNDQVRDVCDRFAAGGFTAYAPDLYDGLTADTPEAAEELAGPLFGRIPEVRSELRRALAVLRAEATGTDAAVAAVGFSLGAFFALDLSVAAPEQVRAVVTFYGTRPELDFAPAEARYLGHFAAADEFEPLEAVSALEKALREAGRAAEFHTYEGTGHWFFEADRADAYVEAAARLAWDRTLEFLRDE